MLSGNLQWDCRNVKMQGFLERQTKELGEWMGVGQDREEEGGLTRMVSQVDVGAFI